MKILDEFNINSLEDMQNNIKDYLAIGMSCSTILNAVMEIGEGLIDVEKIYDLYEKRIYLMIFK